MLYEVITPQCPGQAEGFLAEADDQNGGENRHRLVARIEQGMQFLCPDPFHDVSSVIMRAARSAAQKVAPGPTEARAPAASLRRRAGSSVRRRITSYNVCYTKLLRAAHG